MPLRACDYQDREARGVTQPGRVIGQTTPEQQASAALQQKLVPRPDTPFGVAARRGVMRTVSGTPQEFP